jgi:hypothetical protein
MRTLIAFALLAGTIAPLDLNTLPAQSSLIVTGRVVDTRTIRNDDAVLEKLSTMRVATVLRGTFRERTLRIRTRTGLAFFDRHLVPGENGVFFLKPAPRGEFEAAYPGSFALFE